MAIGTDRKQSKALLKLGIPKQTADMHISWHWDSAVESKKVWELNTGFPWRNDHIPAWSLGALLEVMPEKITDGRYNYYLESDLKSEIYYNAIGAMIPNRKGYTKKDNIFEAAFEMVKWLLKMEIIKKSK